MYREQEQTTSKPSLYGCWQHGLVSSHVGLSVGQQEYPHIMAAGLPPERERSRRNLHCLLWQSPKAPTVTSSIFIIIVTIIVVTIIIVIIIITSSSSHHHVFHGSKPLSQPILKRRGIIPHLLNGAVSNNLWISLKTITFPIEDETRLTGVGLNQTIHWEICWYICLTASSPKMLIC